MNLKWIGSVALAFLFGSCVYNDIPVPVKVATCETDPLHLDVADSVKASVCGAADGSITVEVTGGQQPYLFSINGGEEQDSPFFSGLESGLYSVSVRDSINCSTHRDNIVVAVEQFDATFLLQEDTECLDGNGTMEITVNESNGPYQFNLDETGFTNDNFFGSLQAGDHFLAIKDNDDCNIQMKVTVPRGFTAVSWQNDILPIMTESCATSGCHNGVSRPNDWRIYSQVKQYASTIRKKTQDRSMPFDKTLPQDKIDLIACWVDDGALNN